MSDKKFSTSRRRVTTLGIFLGVTAASMVAMAAWTTNSSPWAPGSTAQPTHPSVTAEVTGAIWPGDCNDVTLTVSNPMPKGVTITDLNNTGFRNVSDGAASENGNANRLEDFLYQADVSSALDGKVVGAGATRTFTVPNAVCLSAGADDARQNKTFEAGYFVAYQVNAGNEAP